MASYTPSPHSYHSDNYSPSPSPWLQNSNQIPAHLLRPVTHHQHNYHHTPSQSSLSSSLHGGDVLSSSYGAGRPPHSRSTVVKTGLRYAGGYEIGPVMGVGTYGEVRYGKCIDGLNIDSDDMDADTAATTGTSRVSLPPGASVAIKIIDLGRFTDDTAMLVKKEITILSMLDHPHIIRIYDIKEDVAYTGEWCDQCACTSYKRSAAQPGVCSNCSHSGSEHTREETRPVLMLIQELACAGELFGLLMHTGPFNEDIARYYFRQLIVGLEHCHANGVVHRDLKPENLCLDHEFNLKIIDFGLSATERPIQSMKSAKERMSEMQSDVGNGSDGNSGGDSGSDNVRRSRSLSSLSRRSYDNSGNSSSVSDPLTLNFTSHQFSGVGSIPYAPAEVFYVHSIYNHRGYRGALADLWSVSIILFVMILGRPPFMRPLNKTYGHSMRRCRHFVSVMNGEGFGSMSQSAKELIQKLLKINPDERAGFDEIKSDPWFQGPMPNIDELKRVMTERCATVWRKLDKSELIDLVQHQQQAALMAQNGASIGTSSENVPVSRHSPHIRQSRISSGNLTIPAVASTTAMPIPIPGRSAHSQSHSRSHSHSLSPSIGSISEHDIDSRVRSLQLDEDS